MPRWSAPSWRPSASCCAPRSPCSRRWCSPAPGPASRGWRTPAPGWRGCPSAPGSHYGLQSPCCHTRCGPGGDMTWVLTCNYQPFDLITWPLRCSKYFSFTRGWSSFFNPFRTCLETDLAVRLLLTLKNKNNNYIKLLSKETKQIKLTYF